MKLYNYDIEIIRVIDGDTVDVMVDLGFSVWVEKRVRLFDIDAPETRTKDLEEKEKGKATKLRLQEMLNKDDATLESYGVDKYGRCLGTLYVKQDNLNELLISEGFATRYNKS